MGSLTHSRRPNGRENPHHIRCLSCRSGFFYDLLPTTVPGLYTNLPSLVIPRGEAQGRVYLARERFHKAVLTLIRRCYSHIRAPDRPHGRGVLRRRCAQPSAPVERDTPVPFPSPAQGRPCSCLARRRTVSHVLGTGSCEFVEDGFNRMQLFICQGEAASARPTGREAGSA